MTQASEHAERLAALEATLTDARNQAAFILADTTATTGLEEATLGIVENDLRLMRALVDAIIVTAEVTAEKHTAPTTDDRPDLTTDWCSTCKRQTSHRATGGGFAECVVCGSQAYTPPMPSRLLNVIRGGAA